MYLNGSNIKWKSNRCDTSVHVLNSSKKQEIMDRDKVWVCDIKDGFILGRIVDLGEDGAMVEPLEPGRPAISSSFDQIYPSEDDNERDVEDNCRLMYLNEATLLNNIRLRYNQSNIYTYVANILIAINPYCDISKLYNQDMIKSYCGRSLGTMPPHVFAIADKAFRDMKVLRQSQSIIVSGESGAGKTESTKYILKYLCYNFGSKAGQLETKILNANPILEAFGNAKTTRNNNSSRFGKFIEIHFDSRCAVAGGYISHYLLERARIVRQSSEERNYHIFYQLCAGASPKIRKQLYLMAPDKFHYLKNGCTRYFSNSKLDPSSISSEHEKYGPLKDAMLDDVQDFLTVDQDLSNLGMSESVRFSVYTIIASVLHLGNIAFEEDPDDNRGGCRVKDACEESLQITASLMGLDADEIRRALTARVMQATKGGGFKGTVIMVPLKVHEASNARDALAKAIYSRLFDYIVTKINQSIPFERSAFYIGVLDIAGFEYFTVNSFEQFCINYCNEKLQQFFNQRILKDEQELYEKEGLAVKKISFVDNQDCLELIECKSTGIFALLDEESKLPKSNYQHFTAAVHGNNVSHFRLALPRKSKLKEHREIRDDDGFLIRHFAGGVCYQTAHFIEKNNDALHASLEAVAHEASNAFLRALFVDGQRSESQKGKLAFNSVGNKFKSQLGDLMNKLRGTGTNFIRCIKPNVRMVSGLFDSPSILSQLQCAGMTSVLELMQQGFPSRTPFSELYNLYQKVMPDELKRLDSRLFCRALFKALGLNDKDYKFGLTKVFFRPGKFAEFDRMLRSDPENLRQLVKLVKHWLLCSRWKKAQWCVLSVIKLKNKIAFRQQALIYIQKHCRGFITRRQHAPRYQGIIRLRTLQSQIGQIGNMANKSAKHKDAILADVKGIQEQLNSAIAKICINSRISKSEINSLYDELSTKIAYEITNVKRKLESDERERILQIEREMEAEKKRRQDEKERMSLIEEEKKAKVQIESRRIIEVAEMASEMANLRAESESIQAALNAENERLRKQIEQERRDHELALRLAHETGSSLEEPPALKRSSLVNQQRDARSSQKFDLSKWKYAELRDTINTSCDIELIQACREEFHRRLKVYHAWKAKNKKKSNSSSIVNDGAGTAADFRAPSSVMDEAATCRPAVANSSTGQQRYFRIPFVRPTQSQLPTSPTSYKGMWYAHFDGDWIARQLELSPGASPVLLMSGRDDLRMCELRLEETGLTRKRGAEILQAEFDKEWFKHGGLPYVTAGKSTQ